MAWVAEETFESFSDETDIDGGGGGTGWSGNWTDLGNPLYADTATASEGSVSCRCVSNGGGNTFSSRTLTTSLSSGSHVMYVSLRKSSTSAGTNSFTLRSSAGFRASILMNTSGNIVGRTTTIISGYSADTWYDFRLTFDMDAGTYTVAYWTGSAWSAESSSISLAGSGAIDRVSIGGDDGANSWVDNISDTDPHAAGSSASSSPSASASSSPSSSVSSSPSPSVSSSPSPSVSASPSASPSTSPSSSPSAGSSPSSSPSPSVSSSPSPSVSSSPSPSPSASESSSPSPSVSSSPSPSPSSSVSSSPSASTSPSASPSPQTWTPVPRNSY